MKVLFLGDVVGRAGCEFVSRHLRSLKKLYGVDACVINGENSAEGNGITPDSTRMLFDAGADVITTGNHVLKRREIYPVLEEENGIIRPANYHPSVPGSGMFILDKLRWQLCVINLQGQMGMEVCANPFERIDQLLKEVRTPNILVDFHAEMTSEKKAMGYYLDGKISALWGTHTHVPTADEEVFPKGTGYLTDLGMTGAVRSVLGIEPQQSVETFLGGLAGRYRAPEGPCKLQGAVFSLDSDTGLCVGVERVDVR